MQDFKLKSLESRKKLIQSVDLAEDITFIRLFGNLGDDLIYGGARKLLSNLKYSERSVFHLQAATGHTAIIAGSGGWCGPYTELPDLLPIVERRFKQIIVFPSSYDTSISKVKKALMNSNALFFAREEVSYNQIKNLCRAELAHDTAFFFDYYPYHRVGAGKLNAFRTDKESSGSLIPADNDDISLTCESMDEWLWKISGYELICTDRAHVMIAGALLGKKVEYRSSNYHKVPAIADFALKGFPVYLKEMVTIPENKKLSRSKEYKVVEGKGSREPVNEAKQLRRTIIDIMTLVAPEDTFILVDEDQIRYALGKKSAAIPFMEREGEYWGPPADDQAALSEFLRLSQKNKLNFIVITSAAFWWLDYYKEWHQYLRSKYPCIMDNERLVVFDLRKPVLFKDAKRITKSVMKE